MGLFCCIFTLWPGESGWHHRGNTNINVSTSHSGCLARDQRRCDWSARTNVREKGAGEGEEGGCRAKLNKPFDCAGCHPSAVDQNNMVHCNCTHKHGQRTPRTTRKKNKSASNLRARRKYLFCKQDTDTYTGAKPFGDASSSFCCLVPHHGCTCLHRLQFSVGSERWGRNQIASVPKAVDKGVLQHDSTQEGGNHAECTKRVVPALGCVQTAYAHESLTAILSCFG